MLVRRIEKNFNNYLKVTHYQPIVELLLEAYFGRTDPDELELLVNTIGRLKEFRSADELLSHIKDFYINKWKYYAL